MDVGVGKDEPDRSADCVGCRVEASKHNGREVLCDFFLGQLGCLLSLQDLDHDVAPGVFCFQLSVLLARPQFKTRRDILSNQAHSGLFTSLADSLAQDLAQHPLDKRRNTRALELIADRGPVEDTGELFCPEKGPASFNATE